MKQGWLNESGRGGAGLHEAGLGYMTLEGEGLDCMKLGYMSLEGERLDCMKQGVWKRKGWAT